MPINSFLYPGAKASPPAYEVANSCRFDKGSSPSLSKTSGTPTNALKWTFSAWVKISGIANDTFLLDFNTDTNNRSQIGFQDSDKAIIVYEKVSGSTSQLLQTSAQFRDPSAWLNIVVSCDRTLGTDTERTKIYVNGTRVTSFSTADGGPNYPAQNTNGIINTAVSTLIGKYSQSTLFYDGYMCEVVFIDGTAYAASDFGEFDEDSPTIWKPKDPSTLTFGNNGFYLDFEDSSNLGNDANGGTDFTETNIVAADQATDTCTNNFCTMNPLDNFKNQATFSEGNCKLVTASSPYYYNTGTFGLSSGKWYYECKVASSAPSDYNLIGIAGEIGAGTAGDAELGGTGTYSYGYHGNNGKYRSDVPTGSGAGYAYGATYSTSTIGVYIDLDNNKLYFSKDGTLQNSGTGISIGTSPPHGVFFPAGGEQSNSGSATLEFNFGGCPAFSISSGNSDPNGYGNFEFSTTITGDGASKSFYAINSKNLAEYGG